MTGAAGFETSKMSTSARSLLSCRKARTLSFPPARTPRWTNSWALCVVWYVWPATAGLGSPKLSDSGTGASGFVTFQSDAPEGANAVALHVSLLWMRMSPVNDGVDARTTWIPSPT
jgi:hypothetical protein